MDGERYFYDHITENAINSNYEISQNYIDSLREEDTLPKELIGELYKLIELFRRHIGGEV